MEDVDLFDRWLNTSMGYSFIWCPSALSPHPLLPPFILPAWRSSCDRPPSKAVLFTAQLNLPLMSTVSRHICPASKNTIYGFYKAHLASCFPLSNSHWKKIYNSLVSSEPLSLAWHTYETCKVLSKHNKYHYLSISPPTLKIQRQRKIRHKHLC